MKLSDASFYVLNGEVNDLFFTIGKDREFEKIMRVTPGFEKAPKTPEDRGCVYCLYYDYKTKKCSLMKCAVFEN